MGSSSAPFNDCGPVEPKLERDKDNNCVGGGLVRLKFAMVP